jgi:hypothetical protein
LPARTDQPYFVSSTKNIVGVRLFIIGDDGATLAEWDSQVVIFTSAAGAPTVSDGQHKAPVDLPAPSVGADPDTALTTQLTGSSEVASDTAETQPPALLV